MKLTFGSLFAGIGGFDLGLERAGMTCKWQVEIDDYASKVLAKHWPDVVRHDDVRTAGANNLEPVDLICGGFPCQDVSFAGKGEGLAGKRSGLWAEYARIVSELRPRFVLVENVAALRSRGLGRVLGDLATLGYDTDWDCIPAAAFGAPHIRDRVWIIAHSRDEGPGRWGGRTPTVATDAGSERREAWGQSLGDGKEVASAAAGSAHLANANGERQLQPQGIFPDEWGWPGDAGWWATEPDVGRVAYGVPKRVDRLRCLGNAVVPQVVEWIGRRIVEAAQ